MQLPVEWWHMGYRITFNGLKDKYQIDGIDLEFATLPGAKSYITRRLPTKEA